MKKNSASSHPDLPFSKARQTGNNTMSIDEYKAINENEAVLQRQCEEYLDLMNIDYLRIPESITGLCSPTHPTRLPIQYRKEISKYFKGWPDLILFERDQTFDLNFSLFVELKTSKGKLSQGQRNRNKNLNLIICRSFEDFQALIEKYF